MKRKWTAEEIDVWYKETGAITYSNAKDGNMVVRKPHSLGWTLNWANPKSYALLAAILGCVWTVVNLF